MSTLPALCAAWLALASLPSLSRTQEAPRLAGTVVVAGSGEPVADASVVVRSDRDST